MREERDREIKERCMVVVFSLRLVTFLFFFFLCACIRWMDPIEPTKKKRQGQKATQASTTNNGSCLAEKEGRERESTTTIGTGTGTVQEELSLCTCFLHFEP